MAKFIKSIFNNNSQEKKKHSRSSEKGLEDDGRDFTPPLDGRRKLSISRSGRMKANNRKRVELNNELFGETLTTQEKPKTIEYHVHGREYRNREESVTDVRTKETKSQSDNLNTKHTSLSEHKPADVVSPEDEIEKAFKILDGTNV